MKPGRNYDGRCAHHRPAAEAGMTPGASGDALISLRLGVTNFASHGLYDGMRSCEPQSAYTARHHDYHAVIAQSGAGPLIMSAYSHTTIESLAKRPR